MGTVFKTAAGVLIGLLVYQVIIFLNIEYQQSKFQEQIASQQAAYEIEKKRRESEYALRNIYHRLTKSIASYYRKSKTLPIYVSDLQCSGQYTNQSEDACAVVSEDGVFFARHNEDWVSVEPYVLDQKLLYRCKSSISLSVRSNKYQECANLSISSIPDKKSPPFDCTETTSDVEKIICASDKLIAHEVELSLAYKALLEQNPTDKKRLILDDQSRFMNMRRETCFTSSCVEEITLKKILRLEFLGVWKKES